MKLFTAVIIVILSCGITTFASSEDNVVVVPLHKSTSMDVQVIRVSKSDAYICDTLSLLAECPAGYKVVGGSIDCGADGIFFTSTQRAVNVNSKAWGVEAWSGNCIDLLDPRVIPGTCAPAFVEAICLKIE